MMHHNGTEHNVESLIWKVEMFDRANLEFNRQVTSRRFETGACDLLFAWVNADYETHRANARCNPHRQCARPATHVQHFLSGLNMSEIIGSLTKLPQFAAEQEGVEEPFHQVVVPACIEDQPLCHFR